MLDGDINPSVPTVFELVPESVGIFTPVARGLDAARDPSCRERKIWGAVAHAAKWHQPSDNAVARHLLRAAAQDWRFVFAQFPAVDGYTHQSGQDSAPVQRALRKVDQTVGRLRELLRRRGQLEQSLILLVSDHGASPVHTHLDLADWFRCRGIPTLSHPVVWARKPRAAVMVAGNGSAMVYARPGDSRTDLWPVERLRRPDAFGSKGDLVAELVRERSVALVAGESERGGVLVASAEGEAWLRNAGEAVEYRAISGDPLQLGGSWSGTSREWLERTWDGAYPDPAFQLLDQFRTRRTGDLVVVAREGYDFRDRYELPEHRAGHGSLIRAHMQTPVWSNRPVPAGPMRTVDLFPAMLAWLGVAIPAGIDGEPVWVPSERSETRRHPREAVLAQ